MPDLLDDTPVAAVVLAAKVVSASVAVVLSAAKRPALEEAATAAAISCSRILADLATLTASIATIASCSRIQHLMLDMQQRADQETQYQHVSSPS